MHSADPRNTGASDEQIEDAAERWYSEWRANGLNLTAHLPAWPDLDERTKANVRNAELVCFQRVVPPGMVIAPAADVVTAEDREAIGRAWTLIAAMREVWLYDDLSQAVPPGFCPVCKTGVEDPSSFNADRATAYTADEAFTDEDADILARLAAGGDGR